MVNPSVEQTRAPGGMLPDQRPRGTQEQESSILYISLGPEGAFKAGTCEHCVVHEQERPERAWDAEGDRELDFDRDTLFAELAELGIVFTNRQAYICP